MRKALLDLRDGDYWVYGPAEHEFEFVIDLIQRHSDYGDSFVSAQVAQLPTEGEFVDAANEVSSDLAYYNHIEKGLLWSFALWRIQGIFEALIVWRYLPTKPVKPLIGLRSKLQALLEHGYTLSTELRGELEAWANLRNLLSHAPPEHFSPIAVDRQDLEEYVSLLREVCAHWGQERNALFPISMGSDTIEH